VGPATRYLHRAAASFWREWHRELHRHAGDERLPYSLRAKVRGAAARALDRAAAEERLTVTPRWSRRAISAAPPARLSSADERRALETASAESIPLDQPLAAIEPGVRGDVLVAAVQLLSREGYNVVHIANPRAPTIVDRYVVQASAFVICWSAELQRAACEAHTPSLRLDARDPLTAYPIRADSLFTLATVVDLDTGETLAIQELLTERYFRNTRNCGYRASGAQDVCAAVAEMIEGVRGGWHDTAAQADFRRQAAAAGVALAARVRHIVEWDAASGFIGEGRLANVQAERAR
jgi:hypothetical protein